MEKCGKNKVSSSQILRYCNQESASSLTALSCELSTHPDSEPCVSLMTGLRRDSKNVSWIVGLQFFHKRSFVPQGCVIHWLQWVGREFWRIETPGDTIFPWWATGRGRGDAGRWRRGCWDEATVPRLTQLSGNNYSSFRVAVEPPRLRDETASLIAWGSCCVVYSRLLVRVWCLCRGRQWGSNWLLVGGTM